MTGKIDFDLDKETINKEIITGIKTINKK